MDMQKIKSSFLTIAFFSISLLSVAQDPEEFPFKKAKRIIIECDTSVNDLYRQFSSFLAGKGYALEITNSGLERFTTGLRNTSKLNFSYRIHAWIENEFINITIQWRLNSNPAAGIQETPFYSWKYSNSKNGNVEGIIYNDVMAVIRKFSPGQRILFAR